MMRWQNRDKSDDDPGPLGREPHRSVGTLADLGLSDDEIARYFRVKREEIRRVRSPSVSAAPGTAERPFLALMR